MFASHHELDNLNLIVDDNSIAMLGRTNEIVSHGNLKERFISFGWDAALVDGHDIAALYHSLSQMKSKRKSAPKVLIAKTIKGRGVPGLEDMPLSHIMAPKRETLDALLEPKS